MCLCRYGGAGAHSRTADLLVFDCTSEQLTARPAGGMLQVLPTCMTLQAYVAYIIVRIHYSRHSTQHALSPQTAYFGVVTQRQVRYLHSCCPSYWPLAAEHQGGATRQHHASLGLLLAVWLSGCVSDSSVMH